MSRTKTCTHHCRECQSHFSSLAAFDAHKPRSSSLGYCQWPEDAPLNPIPGGECRIASGSPLTDVTIWEHANAQLARERYA